MLPIVPAEGHVFVRGHFVFVRGHFENVRGHFGNVRGHFRSVRGHFRNVRGHFFVQAKTRFVSADIFKMRFSLDFKRNRILKVSADTNRGFAWTKNEISGHFGNIRGQKRAQNTGTIGNTLQPCPWTKKWIGKITLLNPRLLNVEKSLGQKQSHLFQH